MRNLVSSKTDRKTSNVPLWPPHSHSGTHMCACKSTHMDHTQRTPKPLPYNSSCLPTSGLYMCFKVTKNLDAIPPQPTVQSTAGQGVGGLALQPWAKQSATNSIVSRGRACGLGGGGGWLFLQRQKEMFTLLLSLINTP